MSTVNHNDDDEKNEQPQRTQKQRNHYQILGVDECAALPTIKAAHRSLALKYHPDKQKPIVAHPSSTSDTVMEVAVGDDSATEGKTITYLSVQAAWECLRDPETRRSYDDSLRRARERRDGSIGKAKVVLLSEMMCEYCDVEFDDDENCDGDDGDDADGQVQRQKVYTVECRCGDIFEVLDEDVQSLIRRVANDAADNHAHAEADEGDLSEWDGMCECQSCSLTILISVAG